MTDRDPIRLTRKQALRLIALTSGAALAPSLVPPAFAADAHAGHTSAEMGGMTMAPDMTPATQAYTEAAAKMHAAMDIPYTGDPDLDFVRGMIAHHQGAIDMAQVEIQYGKAPDIRQLAEGIVVAQEKEIGFMKAWLAAHGG